MSMDEFAVPLIGIGVDVHPYDPTRPLYLAGLHWPGEVGLGGHSDGDVAAHACCDALLSAAGLGDLGSNFGSAEPEWKAASGVKLLEASAHRVRSAGLRVGNITVSIIANRPQLGSRRAEAQTVMSEAAGGTVSISATTTDGLGLTGRGEGIGAIATALLLRNPVIPAPSGPAGRYR